MTLYYKKEAKLVGDLRPSRLFVAEGDSEAYFIDKVLTLRGASPSECCVICIKGLAKLQKKLEVISKQDNFKFVASLCFMLDAENSPAGRLESVRSGCRRIGFIDVSDLNASGIYNNGGKSLGVFISPGDSKRGRIEDMIVKEIEGKQEFRCIDRYADCMSLEYGKHLDAKSVVQTYISAVNGSLCGAGRAFEAGILDPLDAAYTQVVQIIDSLTINVVP